MSWRLEIDAAVDRSFDRLVAVRRRMHMQPEPSGAEQKTSLFLYQLLGDEGFSVRLGPEGCGVIADLPSSETHDTCIALRADIDALYIHDAKPAEYRSQCDGVMHACGHDAHTAIVLGATLAVRDVAAAGSLPRATPLRALFQPAEETGNGAKAMIEVGAIDRVTAILATHVDPSRKVGHVGLRTGVLTANCDEMRIVVRGRGGHAARPHESSDPIAAAAQFVNALYLFVPRSTDSQDAVVVTIGEMRGGDNANVIPEEVTLRGTIRTLDARVRGQTFEHIKRLAEGIGQMTLTRIDVEYGWATDSVINDAGLVALLRRGAREVVGDAGVEEIARPSMGSEDFAAYLQHTPGAMIRLGCVSDRAGGPMLHSPLFDVDEEVIRHGAKILAHAAVYWSEALS
ncbi:MAG: amidohydrolase [Pirellulales bacterium]